MIAESSPERAQFHELCSYTLSLSDSRFIHQHVVDAFAAQCADDDSKPITVAFALVGLYLHVEENFSGRQVQLAHMRLASHRQPWPHFTPPHTRGDVTIAEVLAAPPGPERDRAIDRWCASVWRAWSASHHAVRELLASTLWKQ